MKYSPEELQNAMQELQRIFSNLPFNFNLLENITNSPAVNSDPLGIAPVLKNWGVSLMQNPQPLWEAAWKFWTQPYEAWSQSMQKAAGLQVHDETISTSDKRFRDPQWQSNPLFEFIRANYLLYSEAMMKLATQDNGLDVHDAHKLRFFIRQFVDAISPTNFALTNPEVIRTTIEQGGSNLIRGFQSLLQDIDPQTGSIRPSMTDPTTFELGRNIAITPGSVIFQNELMQLIQYSPSTQNVHRRPLLIVPPWINKFYILDLQPQNSFVKWLVDQGHTVFMISWRNPDASLRDKDFENYMLEGTCAALDAIEAATGEKAINSIGYCLGGTLLATTLAYLQAKGDSRIKSATLFASLLDFSEVGDISVFIDESQVTNLESVMNKRGFLDGREMATTFSMLRASELIWSFVINNYLLGKNPPSFDLLYWNSDSTRMPAKMHSSYLRHMYLENCLKKPGELVLNRVPIDLGNIKIPCCFISTYEDHIAPWKTTYSGAQLLHGPVKFILGKAGHVAGIINPPGKKMYGHFVGPEIHNLSADEWFAKSTSSNESWWTTWAEWIKDFAGGTVEARKPGEGKLVRLEPAPGSYVQAK